MSSAPATVDATNTFTGSVALTSGTNQFTVTATDPSGNSASATYQVDATGTTASYTYDANGNMTSDGTRTFAWDGENRLVTVTSGTHESDFSYDGLGRRVRIVEKDSGTVIRDAHFIWDGSIIIEERLSTGEVNRFGEDWEQLNGAARYITRDHLGSVREVTDATGEIVTRNDYDPYGRLTKVAGTEDSQLAFAGYYAHGPSGLDLTLYRAYSPELGSWLSEDPLGRAVGSLFGYAGNSPVALMDPLGLCASPPAPDGAASEAPPDVIQQIAKDVKLRAGPVNSPEFFALWYVASLLGGTSMDIAAANAAAAKQLAIETALDPAKQKEILDFVKTQAPSGYTPVEGAGSFWGNVFNVIRVFMGG